MFLRRCSLPAHPRGAGDWRKPLLLRLGATGPVRVALRHRTLGGDDPARHLGAVTINPTGREVRKDGKVVPLTRKEYALLSELARFPGRVLTHEALLVAVWGEAHRHDTEYLRVCVRGLRRKLEADPGSPALIMIAG